MYCIALNGPPRVGKDSVATRIEQLLYGATIPTLQLSMSMPMRLRAFQFLGWTYSREKYEEMKDVEIVELGGHTLRQFMIHDSENCVKPFCGEIAWAVAAIASLGKEAMFMPGICFVPDAGFAAEQLHMQRRFGPDNYLLVRLHRDGLDFSGDSRSYLPDEGFANTLDVQNEYGRLDHCAEAILNHVESLDWDI